MLTFEGLDENFKFIVLEVQRQAQSTLDFVKEPSRALYKRINSRDDYIDNLKTIIENKCFSKIHTDKSLTERQVKTIRAVQVISVNLERIADYCVNIVSQMGYLSDPTFLGRYEYGPFFDLIQRSLGNILPAANKEDMALTLAICRSEYTLDAQYKDTFDQIMTDMDKGQATRDCITALFIFRYLERIGDSLLNIGEALIFAILGERIKIEQFEALQQTLTKSGFQAELDSLDFRSIWGTRSGCRIGRLDPRLAQEEGAREDAFGSIYKEGTAEKIRTERDNIERWTRIAPGLVPAIFGYHEDGEKASLLVEFLPGCTLDETILTATDEIVENALFVAEQTVRDVWEATKRAIPIKTDYMDQLWSRIGSVFQVHPEFRRPSMGLGSSSVRSAEELIKRCMEREQELTAPFTVFTHGDFNVNNLVYSHDSEQVFYIDLYRSRDFDYVQDTSVFLVSNFRMPIFDPAMRHGLNRAIASFFGFAAEFAKKNDDATFEARMAFALARSFYTSTRFELNHAFAREMYMRSVYMLEQICDFSGDWADYRLPGDILYL